MPECLSRAIKFKSWKKVEAVKKSWSREKKVEVVKKSWRREKKLKSWKKVEDVKKSWKREKKLKSWKKVDEKYAMALTGFRRSTFIVSCHWNILEYR